VAKSISIVHEKMRSHQDINYLYWFMRRRAAVGIIKEFKDFILKGNAIDLAVGIIIGAAFGSVVNSLVNDVIMPPIGAVMGGVDFSTMNYKLVDEVPKGAKHPVTQLEVAKDIPAVVLSYGKFINAIIALLIQGFAVFLIVKSINSMKRKQDTPAAPAEPPEDIKLLREIRDSLAK
jgi:large conductance mechanosensitive channel